MGLSSCATEPAVEAPAVPVVVAAPIVDVRQAPPAPALPVAEPATPVVATPAPALVAPVAVAPTPVVVAPTTAPVLEPHPAPTVVSGPAGDPSCAQPMEPNCGAANGAGGWDDPEPDEG